MPVGLIKYDFISKVTYYDDVVNNMNDKKEPTAMELAMEKAKNKKWFSFKGHPNEQALIDYESLTEKPDMKDIYIKISKKI
ncbi:hypothetical protein NE619_08075 [Anaerovorax odorimutans]|uniref:Uncharacterized protein n=1 Tax=Anaerovorax odorimutans TaxID=109327 RepID=A0ABT1RNC2_9FIRM|nr:hypothetical protein [Anaerovorax odorimutans]MCQ4636684.1 hypothetical protein [Anaerovorax odorimutans]